MIIRGGKQFAKARDNTRYGKRHVPGEMNQTESRYSDLLQSRLLAGEIVRWEFESVTFKLAKDLRYTPDFMVIHASGLVEFIDVKGAGPMDEKSRVKIKLCADKNCFFKFSIAKAQLKRDGGGFVIEEF